MKPARADPVEFMTVREAAAILKMSTDSIYRRVRDGVIKAVRIGDCIRIPKTEIMKRIT